jgi:2-polyprenyl-6-methoxyphenol hydroxylase-like FAD-dependent oxidoreductase
MGYTRVVVLGGGPVGLLCAIEARVQGFREVTIIEKRGEYTRHNVPQLGPKLIKHLRTLDDEKEIPLEGATGGASFKQIEPVLLRKAMSLGVALKRPYLVRSLHGSSEKQKGRYKSVVLTIQQCDARGKQVIADAKPEVLEADLLIIATGATAAEDTLVTQTLGFQYEKLKAENYMALGIFEETDIEGDYPEKKIVEAADKIVRIGGICFKTADYQYLLSNLGGITSSDFALLKKSQDLLTQLVTSLKRAHMTTSGQLEKIKDVEQKIYAFKLNIQRARQMVSPEYPAVLVGDAAVTPHPDTGSGYTTGFRGFKEVQKLLAALSSTTNDETAFLSFNIRYELDVAKKALSGTQSICDSNIGLLENYKESLEKLQTRSESSSTRDVFEADIGLIDAHINMVKGHKRAAKRFEDMVTKNLKEVLLDEGPAWLWDQGPGWLWASMNKTWERIDRLTGQKSLLEPQLKALQGAILKEIKQDIRKQIEKNVNEGSGAL